MRIAFIVNPLAGMGGRVGLKGTDGMASRALALGAAPVAPGRAREALRSFSENLADEALIAGVQWFTCADDMGFDALRDAGFDAKISCRPSSPTTSADTAAAIEAFLAEGVELIVFCGGDGTARDICAALQGAPCPILGIPSGVKMYSGVFGLTAARAGGILASFVKGDLELVEADVLDLDEEKYRGGEWVVRLYQTALTPYEPNLTQAAKQQVVAHGDDEVKFDIAEFLVEEMRDAPDSLFLLGPGSTMKAIGDVLGIDKTLLGIDAVAAGRLVGADLDEQKILDLAGRFDDVRLVLGVIGAQGFVVGRGNLQLSPAVLRLVGIDRLIVAATPAKLARTPVLHVDTGDPGLDADFAARRYLAVVTGYRRRRLVRVAC